MRREGTLEIRVELKLLLTLLHREFELRGWADRSQAERRPRGTGHIDRRAARLTGIDREIPPRDAGKQRPQARFGLEAPTDSYREERLADGGRPNLRGQNGDTKRAVIGDGQRQSH